MHTTTMPSPGAPPSAPHHPDRRRSRRTPLPSGRAVLGGLLVAVAALGVFAAYAGAQQPPRTTVVVATTSLPAGHRLSPSDLRTVQVDLPAGTASSTYASVDDLVGAVTLAPLDAEELVQRSAVLAADADAPPVHEFSFPLERERAVDGDLRPGERVDLLATYGTGSDAYTVVLARGAVVSAVDDASSGSLTSSGSLVLTLALGSADEVLDVAHASQVASLTVVRATLAGDGDATRDRTTAPGADRGVRPSLPGTPAPTP
jgi:Flp pilus assembly protein CpaB